MVIADIATLDVFTTETHHLKFSLHSDDGDQEKTIAIDVHAHCGRD
ncbi:MAG TPA: hypothetical protein VF920_13245 [Dongiaceae bacterium]